MPSSWFRPGIIQDLNAEGLTRSGMAYSTIILFAAVLTEPDHAQTNQSIVKGEHSTSCRNNLGTLPHQSLNLYYKVFPHKQYSYA